MTRLIISENPLEPDDYVIIDDVQDVREEIAKHFVEWPDTARIYHNVVSQDNDVTPFDEASVDNLAELDGDVFVIVYPEGIITLIIVLVALVAITVLLKPKVPEINQQNREAPSPNNELSSRANRERINARIPDIYGQVRSFPDLIAPSYKVFDNNREVEIAYMCVGQGNYLISDVRDGDTSLEYLSGASAEFYEPNTSPNNSVPSAVFGVPIDEVVWVATRLPQVEGPEMRPPDINVDYFGRDTVTDTQRYNWNIYMKWPETLGSYGGFEFDKKGPNDPDYTDTQTVHWIIDPVTVLSNDVVLTTFARYTPDGVVELLGDYPEYSFVVGDTLVISNSSTTLTKKPVTVTSTKNASYYRDGSGNYFIEFSPSEPIENGDDFRTNKDFVLTENTNVSLNFDGTYTINSKTSTTLTLDAPASVNSDWNHLNGVTGWITCTVGGSTRTVRFDKAAGTVEVETGNFDSIAFPGDVTISAANETILFGNTYQFSAANAGTNRWQLISPETVTSTWERLVPSANSKSINVTVSQLHNTDTEVEHFNGSYTITALNGQLVTLDNPAAVNSAWGRLTNYIGDTSGFSASTDTFTVVAPTRTVDLSGEYTFVSVGTSSTVLSAPQLVNPEWYKLRFFPNQEAQRLIVRGSETLTAGEIGPFFVSSPNTEAVYCNFYAENGLFFERSNDDGQILQYAVSIDIEVSIEAADTDGNGLGIVETFATTLVGSALNKNSIGITLKCNLDTTKGPVLVTARRTTLKLSHPKRQYVQAVKWRDCYGMHQDPTPHYGAVTTVMTKTFATGNTLALRERKFNCLVTRKVPYITGFTGTYPNYTPVYDVDLIATKDAAQIFCALSLSNTFGNRPASDLDYYQIFEVRQQVIDYFEGDERCMEFCFTFDNTSTSYEEAAQSIANSVFCSAYRQGAKLRWRADIATQTPTLIFNHRNKIPASEKRTVRFENQNDNDAIQLEWVDPVDDSVQTFYIPEDQSGTAPRKIETIGIRNRAQAIWHAYRAWYRLQHQNTTVEFDTTQEAGALLPKDIVLIADNTRAKIQDGEVWGQNVLTLELSQEVVFEAGQQYTIFIQHTDGTVESIPITSVTDNLNVAKTASCTSLGGFIFATPADAGLFGVGDVVTVGNATFTDPVNGGLNLNGTYTVLGVDNVTGYVIFENPGLVNADWNELTVSSVGPRIGVTFVSSRYAKRRVNLAHATKQAISIDPENFARAAYVIRGSNEVAPQLFQIQDVDSKDSFNFQVQASNFDSRYYYLDDLQFWMNFDSGLIDNSTREHELVISALTGKATVTEDPERGMVFDNSHNSSQAYINSTTLMGTNGSYTKAVWVYQDGGFNGNFFTGANQLFYCATNGRIIAGHTPNLTGLSWPGFPSPSPVWQHICVTYDAVAQVLRIYHNGLLKAQRVSVLPPPVEALQPIGNGVSGVITSYCDDLRLWFRCFSEQQVLELYNATKK